MKLQTFILVPLARYGSGGSAGLECGGLEDHRIAAGRAGIYCHLQSRWLELNIRPG